MIRDSLLVGATVYLVLLGLGLRGNQYDWDTVTDNPAIVFTTLTAANQLEDVEQ